MRLVQHLMSLVLAAAVAHAAMAFATVLPTSTLTLAAPNSTYNTLNMTIGVDVGLGNKNSTQSPTLTGSCSTTFEAIFNPTTHAATIQDVTFNLQKPGQVALSNATFGYSWNLIITTVSENIDTNDVLASPYSTAPPTAVSGGLFQANQFAMSLNSGSLFFSGDASGSVDLSTSAINALNSSASSGTVAVSAPTMSGNVATYTATLTVPMALSQTVTGTSGIVNYTAQINANGTMQASGTFQFNFGPRTVNWNAASGNFTAGGNWDVGFAPRISDTGSIANGGSSTLSTVFPASPSALWVGNGSTFTIASGGSLGCGAMVLGKSGNGTLVLGGGTLAVPSIVQGGGNGTLYFNGGTLVPTAASSQFIAGLGAAYVSTSGAFINMNGHNVTISQALQTDPALNGAGDGGLAMAGSGILTLNAKNTYTGGTTVSAGTLKLGSAAPGTNILPAKTALAIGNSGTLDLGGGTQTVASLTGSGLVVNSAGTLAALIVSGSATTTFSGSINDASGGGISLEKVGTGKLILSGTDSFAGGTNVAAGTLILTNDRALADRSNLTVGSAAFFAAPMASSPVGQENITAPAVPVPEPGTFVLAAVLCGAAWAYGKHRL